MRHQAFLIACVTPKGETEPRYRCVAAFQHEWFYGALPWKAVTRFLSLLKQEENQKVVRAELASINGLYGNDNPIIPIIPLPFTHFLFFLAWSVDITDPRSIHARDAKILEASMGSMDGDNNDGITVIDITNPQMPYYCFVCIRHLGTVIDPFPIGTPISAETYIRGRYPEISTFVYEGEEQFEMACRATIGQLEDVPLIPICALHETWPDDYGIPPHWQPSNTPTTVLPIMAVPSLVDAILRPAVIQAIQVDSFEALKIFILVAERATMIKKIMTLQDCFSKNATGFLKDVIWAHDYTSIDLSGFHLDETQLSEIFDGNHDFDAVKILDLSHNDKLGVESLKNILTRLHSLRHLVILDTPISDEEIYTLIKTSPQLFRAMEGLVHPAFLRFDIPTETYPVGLTIMTSDIVVTRGKVFIGTGDIGKISIPYFAPDQIVRALLDYFMAIRAAGEIDTKLEELWGSPVALEGVFAAEARHPLEKAWHERVVPFIPTRNYVSGSVDRWYFAFTYGPGMEMQYAFARMNKEVVNEFYEAFRERLAVNAIGKEDLAKSIFTSPVDDILDADGLSFKSRFYQVFDVNSFSQQLQAEGRPSPDPEAATALFEILGTSSKSGGSDELEDDRTWSPKVMSGALFYEFLELAGIDWELSVDRTFICDRNLSAQQRRERPI